MARKQQKNTRLDTLEEEYTYMKGVDWSKETNPFTDFFNFYAQHDQRMIILSVCRKIFLINKNNLFTGIQLNSMERYIPCINYAPI